MIDNSAEKPRESDYDNNRLIYHESDEIGDYYRISRLRWSDPHEKKELFEQRINDLLYKLSPEYQKESGRDSRTWRSLSFAVFCLAIGTLVSSLVLSASVERERELVERTARFFSTEARILEEIRRETTEELRRKNEEIARFLVTLRDLDDQRASLERELNTLIDDERLRNEQRVAEALDLERQRLFETGLSEREIASRMFRYQIEVEQRYADRLEQFIVEQSDRARLRQVEINAERESAQQLLATATRERDDLLVAFRNRTGDVRETGTEAATATDSVLRQFQENAVLETLLRSQLRERIETVTAAITLGRLDDARDAIAHGRSFIEENSVASHAGGQAEGQFASRIFDSFEILLDAFSPAQEAAAIDFARDDSILDRFELQLEARRVAILSEALTGAERRARQTRIATLDSVDDFLELLAGGDPESRDVAVERITVIAEEDPQLAGVLSGIVSALEAAEDYFLETTAAFDSAVLVGTIALVQPGLVTVERISDAAVQSGDSVTLRRALPDGRSVTIASGQVDEVRSGFFDAIVRIADDASFSIQPLDRVYRLTESSGSSQ